MGKAVPNEPKTPAAARALRVGQLVLGGRPKRPNGRPANLGPCDGCGGAGVLQRAGELRGYRLCEACLARAAAPASTFPHIVDDQLELPAIAAPAIAAPAAAGCEPEVARAAAPASTGQPCRVCGKDDGDERVQVDLHRRCMERATGRALRARRPGPRPRRDREVAAPGPAITRADLVARLAADRAAAEREPAPERARRGRPPKRSGSSSPTDRHLAYLEGAARQDDVDQLEHVISANATVAVAERLEAGDA